MEFARITVAGWALAIAVGAATTGCGGDHNGHRAASLPSTSSSGAAAPSSAPAAAANPSPAQAPDYSSLLIKPGDIGADFATPQPPVLNPNGIAGVAQVFARPDNSRRIGDTILIVADPTVTAAGIDNMKAYYADRVRGTWQPVDIGSNGTMISGNAPDNSQAVTVVLFSEGKAIVNLEFDSVPSDPIDPGVAIDIGRKQHAAIKSGLPG